MTVTLTLDDTIAADFLARIEAANGWTQLTPEQVAVRVGEKVKEDLVRQAINGQAVLAQRATEAAINSMAATGLEITIS